MQAIQAYEAVSLDAPAPGADKDASSHGDFLGEEDARYELVELGATVGPVMSELPARDRQILHMRFVEDLTQSEIAARVGVSQMQVSQAAAPLAGAAAGAHGRARARRSSRAPCGLTHAGEGT